MSRVFEKAYQATEQMINNYPVVYRKEGSGLSETLDKILSGKYYGGKNITEPDPKPNSLIKKTSDEEIKKSDQYKDFVKNITAPPGTLRQGGLSSTLPLDPFNINLNQIRGGVRGLLKSDILEQALAKARNPAHKWGDKIPPELKLYIRDYVPDRIFDGKRQYNPITDKNVDEWFSKDHRENIGKQITDRVNTFVDYAGRDEENPKIGLLDTASVLNRNLGMLDTKDPALGKISYGHYDSTGKWQPGLPDFEGNFTIKDTWDWNRDQPFGPKNITERGLQALSGLIGRGGATEMEMQNLAEAISQTVGAQAKEGEGRKIEFKVPSTLNPYQLMTFLDAMDRPIKTTENLPGLNPSPNDTRRLDPDFFLPQEKEGTYRIGYTEGLPGLGWDPEAFTNDSVEDYGVGDYDMQEAYNVHSDEIEDYGISAQDMADAYGLKGGGKVMNKGLTSIPDNLMINGQPHKLSYITPDEAKTLKAMGGSGRKVNGIPAYYDYDIGEESDWASFDTAPAIDDFSSYRQGNRPADILAGTEILNDPETGKEGIGVFGRAFPSGDSGFVKGGFGERDDPGEKGPEAFNQLVSREATGLEKLFGMGDKFGRITQRQKDIERQAYNEGYNAWRAGPGKYSDPDAYDAFFQANKGNMVTGSQSGVDPTSFALQQAANQNMQVLSGLQQKAEEARLAELGMGFERKGDTEKEVSKSMIESLQAGAVPGLTEVEGYEGLNIPVYMPGGMLSKGLDFISDMAGIIGTGMMNNIPVNIHKDGKITAQSPENDPYFDYSKMELGNEPQTTQRRRVATETADATDVNVDEEEEFTGIKGLLARKGKPTTTSSALDALMRERVNTLYGRNIFA